MCTPTRSSPVGTALDRERVVDLGGLGIVDGERVGALRLGKLPGLLEGATVGESRCHAGRIRRRSGAGSIPPGPRGRRRARASFGGASPALRGRLVERAPLEARLVGLEEQHVELARAIASGTRPAASSAAHASTCSCCAALLLRRRRGRPGDCPRARPGSAPCRACRSTSGWRAARARPRSPPAASGRGRSTRARGPRSRIRPAPHTSQRNFGSIGSASFWAVGHEGGERLPVEAQQHAIRLHLRALAVGRLHLEGRARLREDRAHAKRPVFLEEYLLHDRAHSTMSGTRSGNDTSVWSPPRTTSCSAPA